MTTPDSNDHCCPICLLPEPLLTASCKHGSCQNCLERVLSTTFPHYYDEALEDEEKIEDAIIACCPTRGRCPLCRKCIDLFELRKEGENGGLACEKILDISGCPLAGLSFRDKEGNMVQFPASDTTEPPTIIICNGGNGVVEACFEEFHYHEKSKIFTGTVDFSKIEKENRMEIWEWIMQFSSDYRFCTHGAIIKRTTTTDTENTLTQHPLAGKWVVRWQRTGEQGVDRNSLKSARFRVCGNSFSLFGITYHLQLGNEEEDRVHFAWSLSPNIVQVAESGVDLKRKPSGPDIGDTIVWTVNDPGFFRIFWTRETKEDIPPTRIERLGNNDTLFSKVQHVRETAKPSYHPGSPWGNVFIQAMMVGLASYHFEDENDVYISYEHIECSDWPPLDDGSPVPSRVPFVNHSYDPETRTFRGSIRWIEAYGACWQGCEAWDYEIVFDTEFLCILSGTVKSFRIDGALGNTHHYGEDLNYINAGLVERVKGACVVTIRDNDVQPEDSSEQDGASAEQDGAAVQRRQDESQDNDDNMDGEMLAEERRSSKVKNMLEEIRNTMARLTEEGVGQRTSSLVSRASRGALSVDLDPIDYNL